MTALTKKQLRPYRTDLQPNLFLALQEQLGLQYSEPEGECPTLFWPGCALATYASELNMAVYAWLRERLLVDGITVRCCGNILRAAATPAEQLLYLQQLRQFLLDHQVRTLITACPNCFYALRDLCANPPDTLPTGSSEYEMGWRSSSNASKQHEGANRCGGALKDGLQPITVRILSDVLLEQGLYLTPKHLGAQTVAIHDSCPDRQQGIVAQSVRALCQDLTIIEMRHNRQHSRCCGLANLMFLKSPESSERLRQQRLREFRDTGAHVLLTYCMSCPQALRSDATCVAGNLQPAVRAQHYLEPLFGVTVNWDELF
jgi:Fe-S oxidoreductase